MRTATTIAVDTGTEGPTVAPRAQSERRVTPRQADDEVPPEGRTPAETFETFFELEHAGLFGAMLLVTRNRQEAEDLMQEAFLRVWERWDRIGSMDDPTGYLYRTAMNAFRMGHRHAAVAAKHAVARIFGADPSVEVAARDAVDRLLVTLTPRQRAAIVLTEMLGHPSEEAGRILGIRATTVRVLAARARQALRSHEEDPRG